MTKAVSNWDIFLLRQFYYCAKNGHFSINFASYGVFCPPPPNTIRVYYDFIFYLHILGRNDEGQDSLNCLGINIKFQLGLVLKNSEINIKQSQYR